jgi:hypothetical protein
MVVGRITRAPGLQLATPDGEPYVLDAAGFDHFGAMPDGDAPGRVQ